ncbi:MAG TPA: DUF488 family protein [Hyphomicrobium sp.]|nr:DUF488 family protein [Hyphomicrobium sp.]
MSVRARKPTDRPEIQLKRAYAAPAGSDGTRILVDRIWPRGLRKENAKIDLWLKDIAPSTELRRWFHEDETRWPEFQRRYRREIRGNEESLNLLEQRARTGPITLLFAAADVEHNNAVVLRGVIAARLRRR